MLNNPGFFSAIYHNNYVPFLQCISKEKKLQEQLNKMDKKNQNLIKNLIVIVALIDVALLIYLF